jgi:chromosome segregation ATPase
VEFIAKLWGTKSELESTGPLVKSNVECKEKTKKDKVLCNYFQVKKCETELPPTVQALRALQALVKQYKADVDKKDADISDRDRRNTDLQRKLAEADTNYAVTKTKLEAAEKESKECSEVKKDLQQEIVGLQRK